MNASAAANTRNIALVGPYTSGKTTLLESLLFVAGAISRRGRVADGNTVGDGSAEARARQMSVEVSAASMAHEGALLTFLDCPGSVEFAYEAQAALIGVDVAVVVCEPDASRAWALSPLLKFLDDHDVPHMLFINKMDQASTPLADLLAALQPVCSSPLIAQQVPIREGESVTGYVDLISDTAFAYKEGVASEEIGIPDSVRERAEKARTELLEKLADFDDALLEQLLEDEIPPVEEVVRHLARTLAEGKLVPVLLGAAEHDMGVRRLLDSLVRVAPTAAQTAARRGLEADGPALAQVLKTYMTPHGGKLSLVRVWRGEIADGTVLNGERAAGVYRLLGQQQTKLQKAAAGEIVALGRLEGVKTGDTLVPGNAPPADPLPRVAPSPPVYALAIGTEKREDEVKMSGAVAKVMEEDPALFMEQNADTREFLLLGQGEMHLRVALDRLRNKYHLSLRTRPPAVPYKEAIRKSVSQHGRFKRQTGGHGQFGDVHLDIKPLPRGTGFRFRDTIAGGVVPKQYIPAVEAGVREYLRKGPLGFPVVDVEATLTDGQHHPVDSSEQAFKQAARIAMSEGMPKCAPVLLEPVYQITISVPSEYTPKIQRLVSARRGQVLGFAPKEGWPGWDEVNAQMPQAEMQDLIVELRSLTLGVGAFEARFERLQELTGKLAEQVLAAHAEAS